MARRAHSYSQLDPAAVRDTIQRLRVRIQTRFPDRNLPQVAAEVGAVAADVAEASARTRQQHRTLKTACRAGIVAVAVITLTAFALAFRDALSAAGSLRAFEWLPILESAINDAVFAAVAIYFLAYLPNRLQRASILANLHRLRSLAHVIDMHQLTKDPERLQPSFQPTQATLRFDLDGPALSNYLDYCSELLSLVAKTAALCAEESTDAVVLDTVSEIETLTNGMSRKIWQKITVLHQAA